jgi:16S rRNA (guanine1207-N2)-methyltransferase
MHGLYGAPPADLATPPADAVQFSGEKPGAASLEQQPAASLAGMTMLAPRGMLERRYVLALALRAVRPGATLTVMARKTRGGTRLREELADFGCPSEQSARRHHRICTCQRPATLTGIDEAVHAGAPRLLDDLGVWSQPGIFSWDRIDPGSALLLQHLPALSGRGADFGCGHGILTRSILQQPDVRHMTLIDIDRRAIEAARRNIADPRAAFLWADIRAAGVVPTALDFVVMNPPFHDGGAEDLDLGRLFLRRASEALRPGGVCLVTANRHLPYEAAMRQLFKTCTLLAQTDGYKVYAGRT